jgi:hypothetical protein
MAGLSRPISNCVDLFTECRFFEADFELKNSSVDPESSLGDHDGRNHGIIVGIKFPH